jgi:hypothetical protein
MAFDIQYMAKVSSSGNPQGLNVWSYNGATTGGADDTLAEIVASAYFNNFQQKLTATASGPLQVGDTLIVTGSDTNGMYKFDSITTNVTCVEFAAAGGDATMVLNNRTSITLAAFIASNTTPVELLAAPGAGFKHIVHRAALTIDYGGTVLAAGGTVLVTYGTAADDTSAFATSNQSAATIIAATADTMFGLSPVDTTLIDSDTVNAALSLSTQTQDFTGGTGSTYELDLWYSTVAV